MALLGPNVSEVGLRLLLCPLGSNIVIRTACCSVGIALPVYSTFKAIERKDQNEQQRFPLYYHVKFAFLVWLQLPSTDGAKQLYMNHLRPFFLRHQVRIDQIMGIAYGEMLKLISAHQTEIQFARNVFVKIMGAADQMLRGAVKPDQPRQNNAIEGPLRSPDTHSDHND